MMLRPPSEVMRLSAMGAAFPTRLSFLRQILRRVAADKARVTRSLWQMDANGHGRAAYTLRLGGHDYTLACFTNPLDPENRTDRVIATAWDAAFVLYDGRPDTAEMDRLAQAAPQQEAARFTPQDLILSRANKSVRLFQTVTQALASGRQPDPADIDATGYLMRTTAVYGNGKFGIADRSRIARRPGLSGPFAAEMLTVWLIRGFTHDLADHVAASQSDTAASLALDLRRRLGIGNATGLGMAPFLVAHPDLLHRWTLARETAIARVRALPATPHATRAATLMARARAHVAGWHTEDARQSQRIKALQGDLELLEDALPDLLSRPAPWDRLYRAACQQGAEARELVAALMLEPHGDLIDDLAETMASDGRPLLNPAMPTAKLKTLIDRDWSFATRRDYDDPDEQALFWYVSEEKAEPRLGLRHKEPGAELEQPLDVARQVARMAADLTADEPLADFLARHPEHRNAARRVQELAASPYAEIRDNLICKTTLPIDMLRFKLAMFGAARFDPKSDRWTRITLARGAPLFDDLTGPDAASIADDWWLMP